MDQFQRSWKPGEPNAKYPGGIPCHRHQTEGLEDFEKLNIGPRGGNSALEDFEKFNIGSRGVLSDPSKAGMSISKSKCIKCCKKLSIKDAITKQPDSLHSDSFCGICNRDYPEVTKAIHGTNECRTGKITKPIDSTASIGSAQIKIVRNANPCPNCPQPIEIEESLSSCGMCSHIECKKPPRSDLALILSVLDKNKGCDCGTVARALRTGVHGYMRIGHRFSGSPLPPDIETIDSEHSTIRKDSNDDSEAADGIDKGSNADIDTTVSKAVLEASDSKAGDTDKN